MEAPCSPDINNIERLENGTTGMQASSIMVTMSSNLDPVHGGSADKDSSASPMNSLHARDSAKVPTPSQSPSASNQQADEVSIPTSAKSTMLEYNEVGEVEGVQQKPVLEAPDVDDPHFSKIQSITEEIVPPDNPALSSNSKSDIGHSMEEKSPEENTDHSASSDEDNTHVSSKTKTSIEKTSNTAGGESEKRKSFVRSKGNEDCTYRYSGAVFHVPTYVDHTRSYRSYLAVGEMSDDEKTSRDATAESRNNLYWCARYNCACLW